MKIKQQLIITQPDEFLTGNFERCFTLFKHDPEIDPWIHCGEIEFEVDVDHDTMIAQVIQALDAEIEKERAEHSLKMDMLNTRRNELLALTHEPDPAADFERDGDEP